MLLKLLVSILASCTLTNSFAQERLWLKQSTMSEIISFEKKNDPAVKFLSQKISLAKGYYPLEDKYPVANPIVAQRNAQEYLPVYAEYYFTPGDSILRLVSYDWEKDRFGNFFDKEKIWKEESKKFGKYNSEYERIKKALLMELGLPISTDTVTTTSNNERGKYFTRETIWDTEEIHAKLNMVFESMTYRVRLVAYWKK